MSEVVDNVYRGISAIFKLVVEDKIFIQTNAWVKKEVECLARSTCPLIPLNTSVVGGGTLIPVGFAIAGTYGFKGSSAGIVCINPSLVFTRRYNLSLKNITPRKE